MNTNELIRRCFVIGPMNDMARLNTLARSVILPIVKPYGFKIITPDEGTIGTIMDQVLLNLEQADILVADVSGNNPNVMYELGVYHSFGKPSLIIKDSSIIKQDEQTPFDIAAYRFIELPLEDVARYISIMKPKLEAIIEVLGERDWFPNPVTKFYDSPVAEIPTAVGLSKNYLKNFMSMIVPKVFRKFEDRDDYELKVYYEDVDKNQILLDKEMREKLKLEILIPERMHMSNHDYIRNLKESKLINLHNAKVFRRARDFNMHLRFDKEGTPILIDLPTVLSTLNESIQRRRGLKENQIDNSEWLLLEKQELERFANKCELFKKKMEMRFPGIRNRINVVWRWAIDTEDS